MKNFRQSGDKFTYTAGGTVTSGDFVQVGALYGVAEDSGGSGDVITVLREGVFKLPKTTGTAWSQGDPLFWDSGTSKFTKDGTKSSLRAIAFADAASGDATGLVMLNESGGGLRFAAGVGTLDGANPTPITTGFTACLGGVATLSKTTAPGVGTSVLTTGVSSGTLNVYAWKPTSNADPTLIASTGTEDFDWVAWGT